MISIQCIGRRRLDISHLGTGQYEIKIMLTGPENKIATLVVEKNEFRKFGEFFEPITIGMRLIES